MAFQPFHISQLPQEFLQAMSEAVRLTFELPQELLSRGPGPTSGREIQMRQEAAMEQLRRHNPVRPRLIVDRETAHHAMDSLLYIVRYEPITPDRYYIDPDLIFARKKIGGKLYRKEVAWINEHGFVVIHGLEKSEKCMAVVKNDSMVPDWNWKAMQAGENWAKRGTPWESRIPR